MIDAKKALQITNDVKRKMQKSIMVKFSTNKENNYEILYRSTGFC